MLRGKWFALVLVVTLVTVAAAAQAKEAPKGHRPGAMAQTHLGKFVAGMIGRLLDLRSEVNLTDQQKAEIKKVVFSHGVEIVNEVKQLCQKRRVLRDAVLAEHTDEQAIRKAADELGHEIGNAAVGLAKLKGEIAPILTSEQKDAIKKFIKDADQATDKLLGHVGEAKAPKKKAK